MAGIDGELSRIRDVDRNSKILRDIPSKMGHHSDLLYQPMIKQKYRLEYDTHRAERDVSRVAAAEVCRDYYNRESTLREKNRSWFRSILPTFDGSPVIDDFWEWVDSIEDYFDETQPPERLKCKLASYTLENEAESWWLRLQRDRVEEGKMKVYSWTRMKRLLAMEFLHYRCSRKVSSEYVSAYVRSEKSERFSASEIISFRKPSSFTTAKQREQRWDDDYGVSNEHGKVKPLIVGTFMPVKCLTEFPSQLNMNENNNGGIGELTNETHTSYLSPTTCLTICPLQSVKAKQEEKDVDCSSVVEESEYEDPLLEQHLMEPIAVQHFLADEKSHEESAPMEEFVSKAKVQKEYAMIELDQTPEPLHLKSLLTMTPQPKKYSEVQFELALAYASFGTCHYNAPVMVAPTVAHSDATTLKGTMLQPRSFIITGALLNGKPTLSHQRSVEVEVPCYVKKGPSKIVESEFPVPGNYELKNGPLPKLFGEFIEVSCEKSPRAVSKMEAIRIFREYVDFSYTVHGFFSILFDPGGRQLKVECTVLSIIHEPLKDIWTYQLGFARNPYLPGCWSCTFVGMESTWSSVGSKKHASQFLLLPSMLKTCYDEDVFLFDPGGEVHLSDNVAVMVGGGLIFELFGLVTGNPYVEEDDIALCSWESQNVYVFSPPFVAKEYNWASTGLKEKTSKLLFLRILFGAYAEVGVFLFDPGGRIYLLDNWDCLSYISSCPYKFPQSKIVSMIFSFSVEIANAYSVWSPNISVGFSNISLIHGLVQRKRLQLKEKIYLTSKIRSMCKGLTVFQFLSKDPGKVYGQHPHFIETGWGKAGNMKKNMSYIIHPNQFRNIWDPGPNMMHGCFINLQDTLLTIDDIRRDQKVRLQRGLFGDEISGLAYAYDGNHKLGLPTRAFCSGSVYFIYEAIGLWDAPGYYDFPRVFLTSKHSIPYKLCQENNVEPYLAIVIDATLDIPKSFEHSSSKCPSTPSCCWTSCCKESKCLEFTCTSVTNLVWRILSCKLGFHLTRGRVIPWERGNDENNANMGRKFIIVEISVIIVPCLDALCKKEQPKKALKLFHKMVNGLDPPLDVIDPPTEEEQLEDEFIIWGEMEMM